MLFHCCPLLNRSSKSVDLDRLPLWQWLSSGCHISYVSMTASGLTNVTKLCFISKSPSKSPAGPSQESIWIRRENYSSCSLLLTNSALCRWTCSTSCMGLNQWWINTFFHLLRSFICCFSDQGNSKGQTEVLGHGAEAPVFWLLQGRLGHPWVKLTFLQKGYGDSDRPGLNLWVKQSDLFCCSY